MTIYYGLTREQQVLDMAADVVSILGGGKNAYYLLVETAAQETHLGRFRDPTEGGAGEGLTQFDQMPFDDVIARTNAKYKALVKDTFGIDLNLVHWNQVSYSPLLALIMTRLKYRLVPSAIPETLQGRAAYWKEHYNTVAGKGTEAEYIENAKRFLEV